MLKIDRQNFIMNELKNEGSILISNLSDSLNCHEETIRRDLKELESIGKLKRIHGGAYLPDYSDRSVPIDLRTSFFKEEKREMAQIALSFISPGDTIMLDSSTTCLQLAQAILDSQITVTLITNSLRICVLCDSNKKGNATLVCAGGQLRKKTSSFVGYKTTDMISSNFANIAFLSNPAINIKYGLTDNNLNEANVRKCMLEHSKQHIFLMDHTKFSKTSSNVFGQISDMDILITNKKLNKDWETILQEKEVRFHYTC
ncbi:MAG: DeoR/GlpR family DNA-binding transcription regulator [Lachnospiraceae bacterium]|uniref:DeoR/GlpR family DNA-binding transcription regulator n=1 Tax=Parablautia sp. Marseille-Q6255 TaxID=3039593 RepID=UPI0024BC0FF3|nr:DeoR/GlpR family DNA-binding transcription regulator [Parablautia sp. Marseille-Q6255]